MIAKPGDRIVVESEKVGIPTRQGEIVGVVPHDRHLEFRVRWDDGHQSEIRPPEGSYRIVPAGEGAARV